MIDDLELIRDAVTGAQFRAAVNESRPRELRGRTEQRVTLLLPGRTRLNPPTRLILPDGENVRVLGSQLGPSWDQTTLVTCTRVNPDLPDEVTISEAGERKLDVDTNRMVESLTELWRGEANINGDDPRVVDAAGERAPLDEVAITLPLGAPVKPGLIINVVSARHPSVLGARYRMAGEVDSSISDLRQVIAHRLEESS